MLAYKFHFIFTHHLNHVILFIVICSVKMLFLILRKIHRKTPAPESFLTKLQASSLQAY